MAAKSLAVMPKTQPEDVLLQKKLLPVEIRLMYNIIETCISEVEIAASLPGIIQFYKMSGVVEEDLSKAIQAHQILEERAEKLNDCMPEPDGKLKGEDEEARRREMAKLGRDIKNSVRDVLRAFKKHPNAFFAIKTEQALELGESEQMLIKGLKLIQSNVVEQFLPNQERNLSKQTLASPEENLECLIEEEKQLDAKLKKLDEQMSKFDGKIKNMQSYLEQDLFPERDGASLPCKQEQPNEMPSELQQEMDQLTIQLHNQRLENGEIRRTLRKKNEMLVMETKNVLSHFDEKMAEMQTQLEQTKIAYEKEVEELREMEKPFIALEVEHNQILEKRRLAEERRVQEKKDLELKTKAAITIQAWWRGTRFRKALKNQGKTKKTKKARSKSKKRK
ncbi:dynein regulatory complex protein 10 isoform X2 [Cololabis saira]|nr:dynein regulatory complex protein 10 isoform X2 [Cololabis saira]